MGIKLIFNDTYLGDIERVTYVGITTDHVETTTKGWFSTITKKKNNWTLRVHYKRTDGTSWENTTTSDNRDYLSKLSKEIISQLKTQDSSFVDEAFEKALMEDK